MIEFIWRGLMVMLFLEDVVDICENSTVLKVIYFINELMKIVFIIVPILLLLILSIDIGKCVIANNGDDMKKIFMGSLKKIISIVFMFLVPSIVDFLMILVGNFDGPYTKCGLNASNLDTISSYEAREKAEVKDADLEMPPNIGITPPGLVSPGQTSTASTGVGKGKPTSVTIEYNKKDASGRCGKAKGDYCSAIATVHYPKETVKFYMGQQDNTGIIKASCRSHALMSVINAIKGTTYSTLDLQNYLKSVQKGSGVMKAKGIDKAIKKYGLKAKVYHSELSISKAEKVMKEALDNGQPVMIFVSRTKCSDLAGSHHALLLLGYDKKQNVQFIDSVPYGPKSKKRGVKELAQCLSRKEIADSYYRMIVFSYDS